MHVCWNTADMVSPSSPLRVHVEREGSCFYAQDETFVVILFGIAGLCFHGRCRLIRLIFGRLPCQLPEVYIRMPKMCF